MFPWIKSMENPGMDIEFNNNNPQQSNIAYSSQTDKLLKENNVLLHTLIMQNKIHFEYKDDKQYTTNININQHAKNTKLALDNLYKLTNTQLEDKALHIPMTGQTKKESLV